MAKKQLQKSRQTKLELMQSAVELFGEKGFVSTTILEITERAGYAKGNFYRYWKSKDDIFLEIMEKRLSEYRETRKDGLKKARSIQDVMEVIVDFLETIIDDKNWSKVFLEFTIHAFSNPQLRGKLNKSNYRLSTDLFARILSPFYMDTENSKKLGALVTALFEGFLIQQALDSKVIDKKDLREAIMIMSKYFLKV
ncbi:hypothetical protein JCM13304A_05990 [Desulfothermus okinawensis JCM 13304]